MGRPPNKLHDVENYFIPEPNTGCWIWLGTMLTDGYGQFAYSINGVKFRVMAHRAVWEFIKEIPIRYTLDHLCRNRWCVNPEHLEDVILKENLRRGFGAPALNARKSHCKNGHELVGHNLIVRHRKTGDERECRICINYASNSSQIRRRREKNERAIQETVSGER